jgi:hypothetical protein
MRLIQALGGAEEQRPEPADRVGGNMNIAIPFTGGHRINCHFLLSIKVMLQNAGD